MLPNIEREILLTWQVSFVGRMGLVDYLVGT